MAAKKANLSDRINNNANQGKRIHLQMKPNTSSFTDSTNDNTDDIVEKSNDNVRSSNSSDSISFKSYINNAYKLDSNEIKYDIDVIVLNAVNSVQFKYDRNEEDKMIRINYFDDKTNGKLLKEVVTEIRDLVQSIDNITVEEKNDYFSRIIDDFLRKRLKYIINVGLEQMLSPAQIEHSMEVFMSSGKDLFDNFDELLNEYLDYYKDLAFYLIENRVDRCTFYINELNLEAIKLIKKDRTLDISAYINDLITNNFDEIYIEKAKKNIYNRKPFNTLITKTHKKVMKHHELI